MHKPLLLTVIAAAIAVPHVASAQEPTQPVQPPVSQPPVPQPPTPQDSLKVRTAPGDVELGNVVAVARTAGNFTVFLRAIEAAGLADTLAGEGPFTIFAPTDEAFAKLPAGKLDSLLADTVALRTLLLNHVVAGRISAADAATQDSAKALGGGNIAIVAGDSGVKVNGAAVVKADIAAGNGVVHAVDAVFQPSAAPSTLTPLPPTVPPVVDSAASKPAVPPTPEVKPAPEPMPLPQPTPTKPPPARS